MIRYVFLILGLLLIATAAQCAAVPPVYVLQIEGHIDPAMVSYLRDGIEKAQQEGAQAVLITMDTPGGLVESTRQIIQVFFASQVPIIVYVAPNGAWAASAGAFITIAADIAAMAPVSNIGSSSPVSISPTGDSAPQDETMKQKTFNALAEYARSVAERRGRNADWAEKAVREAANLTSSEALKQNVIDYVAPSTAALMNAIDGKQVKLETGRTVTLRTADAPLVQVPMGPWDTFLHYLSNPLVALFLMLLAMYGIIYELASPGAIFPGVIGGISLILLLYSFSVIPVNAAGFAFIALAAILFVAELFVPGTGLLAGGGVVSLFLGLMMLFRNQEGFMLPIWTLVIAALLTGAFFAALLAIGVKALRKPYVAGREGIVGGVGEARTDLDPIGKVFVEGALWTATSTSGKIARGEKVEVTAMDGLRLTVRRYLPQEDPQVQQE